ncbi:DUF6766 family protein [Novosphingobium sp. JCM 18896]|uniref:DUF6766 family protein n=1 Tax=Novosphingobium sp. JCM 18896 TaxID=2989731 RepID=UPI002221FDE7|nr:DUF6766 family protein [Novosphingobium sp. JCM 18896]MCW1430296.1 hypothetical protein [Novosphingobium sp. JCM 18896]
MTERNRPTRFRYTGLARAFKANGLTIVLLLLFAVSIGGQLIAGWRVTLEDQLRHGAPTIGLAAYAASPEFVAAVFENWESEFLQMSTYVVLTAMLFQRGSAESKDPDSPPRDEDIVRQALQPDAPRILRKGRFWRALYARSLGLALAGLFAVSFAIHWLASARAAGQEALEHGEAAPTALSYLADPQLWFESFQNWQSEFLSTAVLVVFSIFLRQKESPESKAVAAPHHETGS